MCLIVAIAPRLRWSYRGPADGYLFTDFGLPRLSVCTPTGEDGPTFICSRSLIRDV
jgi:hypothetical protein